MQDLKNVRRKLIDHLSWSERVELQGYKRNRLDNLLAACSPSVSCITVPNTVNDNYVKQACSYYGRVDVQIRPEPLSQFKKAFLILRIRINQQGSYLHRLLLKGILTIGFRNLQTHLLLLLRALSPEQSFRCNPCPESGD